MVVHISSLIEHTNKKKNRAPALKHLSHTKWEILHTCIPIRNKSGQSPHKGHVGIVKF